MRTSTVQFRAESVDVEWRVLEDDPTTNALEIEWNFVEEPSTPATEAENDAIYCELAKQSFETDYFEDDAI